MDSFDSLISDGSSKIESQELPLSQSSNWSTTSEGLKVLTQQKTQDILRISELFHDLGHTFPDSLKAALDPNVSLNFATSLVIISVILGAS